MKISLDNTSMIKHTIILVPVSTVTLINNKKKMFKMTMFLEVWQLFASFDKYVDITVSYQGVFSCCEFIIKTK